MRLEIVCQHWRQIAKTLGWIRFRTLTLDSRKELVWEGDKALAKYRVLIDRCGQYLRELSLPALAEYNLEQWTKLRNLHHLRFNSSIPSELLRVIADLKRLKSIYFSEIDWRGIAELRALLRVDNASLQALRLSVSKAWYSLGLTALPSSLRSLHITDDNLPPYTNTSTLLSDWKRDRIDELLQLAASCCPKLSILMLPMHLHVSKLSLVNLARFERLFYLRLSFDGLDVELFADTLAKIGPELRALLLEGVDSRVLLLITKHCPKLEHFYFGINFCSNTREGERLFSTLRSVFQLVRLRSVSIRYDHSDLASMQILSAINGLNAKCNIEYLHVSWRLALPVEFITTLIQLNPMRKLTCAIRKDYTSVELGNLRKVLQNMDRPIELELFGHCPAELQKGENSRVRNRVDLLPESISQPMLREFWAQAMDSVPDLGNLDD